MSRVSWNKIIAGAMTLALTLSAASCKSGDASENEGIYGGEAVVGITQEPMIFDPHTVEAAGDREILFNVYEGLFKYDSQGALQPCLATDYVISDDSTEFTFTIREGVTFHDGSELDTGDVVYSLNRAAELMAEFADVTDVRDNGDNTVTVTLGTPNAEMLSNFTAAIIPEGSCDSIGETRIGTGPFVFTS